MKLSAKQRRVQVYLKPGNHAIIKRIAEVEHATESQLVDRIVGEWFKRLPPSQKEKYFDNVPENNFRKRYEL